MKIHGYWTIKLIITKAWRESKIMEMMTGYKGIGGQWESLPANRRRLERPSRLDGTITKDIQFFFSTMKTKKEKKIKFDNTFKILLQIGALSGKAEGWMEQLPRHPDVQFFFLLN